MPRNSIPSVVTGTHIPKERRTVLEFLRAQARFLHLLEEGVEMIHAEVDQERDEMEGCGHESVI